MECNFKIERDPHVKGYTMISNASNGNVLSLAAKGLLKELLSLPPDWYLSVDGLVRNLKESKRVIVSVLKELEDNGYLIKEKRFRQSNTCKRRVYTYFYTIIENPNNEQLRNEGVQNEYLQNEYVQNEGVQNDGVIIINNKEINKYNKDNNKEYKYITPSDEGVTFEQFWDAYDYKKSKKAAERAWNRLSKADKKAAMNAIQVYKQDCVRCGRDMQYAQRYLKEKTFEDDFSFNDNKPNNNGRDNIRRGVWPTPAENATRAEEWATNRILELTQPKDKGIQGEIPDNRDTDKLFLPF